jgi:hypothetical protein
VVVYRPGMKLKRAAMPPRLPLFETTSGRMAVVLRSVQDRDDLHQARISDLRIGDKRV